MIALIGLVLKKAGNFVTIIRYSDSQVGSNKDQDGKN